MTTYCKNPLEHYLEQHLGRPRTEQERALEEAMLSGSGEVWTEWSEPAPRRPWWFRLWSWVRGC